METNINFLSVCLDNARYILQRKKIHLRDFEYVDTTFKLCRRAYLENPTNEKCIDLYSKLLDVQQFMLQKIEHCF